MSALWLWLRLCQFKISWDTLAFNLIKVAVVKLPTLGHSRLCCLSTLLPRAVVHDLVYNQVFLGKCSDNQHNVSIFEYSFLEPDQYGNFCSVCFKEAAAAIAATAGCYYCTMNGIFQFCQKTIGNVLFIKEWNTV